MKERLLIFAVEAGGKTSEKGRAAAERLVNEMVQEKLRGDALQIEMQNKYIHVRFEQEQEPGHALMSD